VDTMKDTTMQHVTDVSIVPEATAEFIAGLLARIEQLESDLATAEQDSRQKQARIDRLEAAERKAEMLHQLLDAHRKDHAVIQEQNSRLRAEIEAMKQQEPVAADINAFRSAFEAALKERNWPATRQGDGYLSPSTQSAWRIAFSTVRRLKLYLAPRTKGE